MESFELLYTKKKAQLLKTFGWDYMRKVSSLGDHLKDVFAEKWPLKM